MHHPTQAGNHRSGFESRYPSEEPFKSPLQITVIHSNVISAAMEIVVPFVLAPWDARLRTIIDTETEEAEGMACWSGGTHIGTGSSATKSKVGSGGAREQTCPWSVISVCLSSQLAVD